MTHLHSDGALREALRQHSHKADRLMAMIL